MADRGQTDHIWDSSGQITSTGSANAYVIATAEPITGYYQGMPPIRFKANFTNSGSATAEVNGLVAVTLKKGGGATNLASGDIVSGGVYTLSHDGTNFQVLELNGTIAAGAVGTTQLADDAVTNAKLANMAQATIKGRADGAGTGDPTDLTGTQATAILDAFTSALKGLAPASGGGTANFLRADATWAAPASGQVLLTSGSVSAAAALSIVLTSYTAYPYLAIVLRDVVPATDNSQLVMRFSTNGGSSYDSGASDYGYQVSAVTDGNTNVNAFSTATSAIGISSSTSALSSDSGASADYIVNLINRLSTTFKTVATWNGGHVNTTPGLTNVRGSGYRTTAQDTDAVQFLFSGVNITSATYSVYGWS